MSSKCLQILDKITIFALVNKLFMTTKKLRNIISDISEGEVFKIEDLENEIKPLKTACHW